MIHYIFLGLAIFGLLFPTILYPIVVKNKVNDHKWPTSYSNTYSIWYRFSKATARHFEHVFTAWTAIESALLLPALTYYSDTYLQICIGAFGLISLAFVGLFPSSIKSEITKLHCIFAKICAVFAMLWLFLKGIYIPTLILLIGGFIWSRGWQKKYETMIMEFVAFLSAYLGVIICALGNL